ncbi:MAG: tRNA (N6-isopentenyl adenosine(37)-C2)-methylthiotransferase MiaB [Bacteroidetes bacterium GWA2_30_7]|nr:MAG: tRNA (N6-isopentenyl adenosine(37)-C2)-methylthiotransferase MiaB [Bacteroidetes bacterium GWA2_30_7]
MSKKLYLETYGCQMNVVDSEVVVSILNKEGIFLTDTLDNADIVLVNTCSVRENAEQRIRGRLQVFNQYKKKKKSIIIGVIGCMAERLKEKLLEEEKMVDLVVGPDSYRDLPKLIQSSETGQKQINVLLSVEETYADISPVRYDSKGVSAFVSITRGCDNMCTYCIVPFTRGRERSRNPETILKECKELSASGYKEVTLLGQNVDSYIWNENETQISFAELLEKVAISSSDLRIRFATSHPSDMSDDVLHIMAKYDNICKSIHLPGQSGSNNMLKLMKRGYTREWYMDRISAIRRILPDCTISTDIIAGFCNETEQDHLDTLSLMEWAKFDFAFMFKYSVRPNTYASKKLEDNVPEEVKSKRLTEIIELQRELSKKNKHKDIGKVFEVLVEGFSKKSDENMYGRNSQNNVVIFPAKNLEIGAKVNVKIFRCTSSTIFGEIV